MSPKNPQGRPESDSSAGAGEAEDPLGEQPIGIASDHAGLALKEVLVAHLKASGRKVADLGTHSGESVDYPSYAQPVAKGVAKGIYSLGILICGSGNGMAIAANKIPGVRAVNCAHEWLAAMARAHNDANVLCLGERLVGPGLAIAIAESFVNTPFEGGRHQRRVDLIEAWED